MFSLSISIKSITFSAKLKGNSSCKTFLDDKFLDDDDDNSDDDDGGELSFIFFFVANIFSNSKS